MAIDGFSQVGINTTSPNAQLDIRSSNQATPTNTDGILIPKIDAFPVTNPTAAQQGMMVYLTTISAGKQPGFYYWDNTGVPQWKGFNTGVSGDDDWYEVGGTTAPNNINDDMFHTGNVGIGNNNPAYKLDVDETASGKIFAMRVRHSNPVDGGISSGIQSTISGSTISGVVQGFSTVITPGLTSAATGLRNLIGGTSNLDVTGVVNTISSDGTGGKTGINNNISGTGTGINYGISNTFSNPNAITLGVKSRFTASGIRNKTGVENEISNSTGGFHTGIKNEFTNNNGALEETGVFSQFTGSSVGNIRGIYNEITNSGSGNIHYGLYNNINGSGGLKRYGVENILSGTSSSEEYGVENTISTSGTNRTHYGVRNYLTGTGTGFRIGTDNWLSGSGTGDQYGVNNYIDNSGTGTKYGIYNYIPPATNGLHYGVYSNATKANSYAGYFLGRFSLGTTITNSYILPSSRGVANQIMQTDGTGNVTWQNPDVALNDFAWTTTGNSGTDPAFNFIGTTDDVDVVFHRDILEAGRIGMNDTSFGRGSLRFNTGTGNTAIGNSALSGFITGFNEGNDNTAIGFQTLHVNTFGSSNVALGSDALHSNKSASKNIAIGTESLYEQNFTNGGVAFDTENVAIGYRSLYNTNSTTNINGRGNIGIGTYALSNNGTGSSNIAIGNSALGASGTAGGTMTGNSNVAIGFATIKSNITGTGNVAMGSYSLNYNTLGDNNVSIGNDALFYSRALSNGTAVGTRAMYNYGISGAVAINDNVAVGYEALKGATCCPIYNQNTAVGYQSLTTNSANNNTANGFQSLFSNATGTANTAFGNEALRTNISGSNNIAIGYQAGYSETGSNKLYIENSNSATPLIYGEFDSDLIRINGKTEGIYTQLTANGDGQSTIFGYRTRDSQNDGTGYGRTTTNRAVGGYNLWGDLYTFGVTGHSDNDFTRTGGVLGSITGGTYWSSLGYKNSGGIAYGVYATAVLATGAGRFSQPQKNFSIGGGFYGGMIGSWSKGNIIGQVSSGTMFASYNSGDEYTTGKQIELVDTGSQKTAAYTVTSTESIVYKKGKTTLTNGTARVDFDKNYLALLGEIPVVTITPLGQCNGLFIESIDQNGFTIKELNNGTSNVAISWIAVGDRIDAKQNKLPKAVLEKDFDNNINEVMFNENNKTETAKAIWFDGTNIQFGQLPSEFIEKNTAKKE